MGGGGGAVVGLGVVVLGECRCVRVGVGLGVCVCGWGGGYSSVSLLSRANSVFPMILLPAIRENCLECAFKVHSL